MRAQLATSPLVATVMAAVAAAQSPIDFELQVRPILQERCVSCHGPDVQRMSLRLDAREAAFAGGRSGAVIVPGKPDQSALIDRVTGASGKKRMPAEGPALTAEQIGVLRRWIAEGACWPDETPLDPEQLKHWSYRRLQRPDVPAVRSMHWVRNPIDAFVLARLEQLEIDPSPEADAATLARRVALRVTGLPPHPEHTAAMISDRKTYASLLKASLDSPHYGEHQARSWLDLARYADTKGYEKDARRPDMWRYRDWVITAFNRNLPYDRFVIEQLAGDLLPDAHLESIVATAFHRQTMNNDEGGTDNEEFRCEAVVDRVDTTMQVFMGTTMGCVRCHDHKYDPLSHREYYEMFAFFNQTEDADLPSDAPRIDAPTAKQRAALAKLREQRAELQRSVQTPEHVAATERWIEELHRSAVALRDDPPQIGHWHALGPLTAKSFGAAFQTEFGPEQEIDLESRVRDLAWRPSPELRDGAVHTLPPGATSAHYLYRTVTAQRAMRAGISLGSDDAVKLWINGNPVHSRRVSRGAAPDQELVVLELREGQNEILLKVVNGGGPSGFYFELRAAALPREVIAAAGVPAAKRSREQQKALRDAWFASDTELATTRRKIAEVDRRIAAIKVARLPILRELPEAKRRKTFVHERGFFLSRGDEVQPGTPAVFHPFPDGLPRNRFGLAHWIVHPDNPLTARVAVNRVWEQMFGTGLVQTSEDWGTQGQRPSHPRLLDWLASDFVEHGWDIKRLVGLIASSATFRQSSRNRTDLADRDPNNRLLARGPRGRLSGEAIRDSALAVANLLTRTIGGPSVMPPQPPGIWQITYSGDRWMNASGQDRYRRGIYTFWRRTSPYPSMLAFDAPSREACSVRRITTNTPIQALVLLNDPAFVECARALARLPGSKPDDLIGDLVSRSLGRPPTKREHERLTAYVTAERARFQADPASAKRLAGETSPDVDPVELAARTALCSVLLNLDEFVTCR